MRFTEAAKQAFSFLEGAGFRLTESDPALLHYESAQVFVSITWSVRSGELEVFLGLQPKKGKARDAYSLQDLLGMEAVDLQGRKVPFQVAEESNLKPFIEKLAEETLRYAQRALVGDRMYFRRLKVYRNAQARAHMRDMEVRRIRAEADEAWQRRELDTLVRLYGAIEGELTESEKAKLAYAKQPQVP